MPKKTQSTPTYNRAYFDSLSDDQLDALWAAREEKNLTTNEITSLRTAVRERKGFKPVDVFVPMCQRCNLPVDNCACLNP